MPQLDHNHVEIHGKVYRLKRFTELYLEEEFIPTEARLESELQAGEITRSEYDYELLKMVIEKPELPEDLTPKTLNSRDAEAAVKKFIPESRRTVAMLFGF